MKDDVRAFLRKGEAMNHRFPFNEMIAALVIALALLACGRLTTITPTAVPPTATVTPIPPTRTATATPIPTVTSTPGVTATPVCAGCKLTVISAKDEGASVLYDTTGQGTYIIVKEPNTHFLAVQVQIEEMGAADVEGMGWMLILMIDGKTVRDRNGNTYPCTYSWSPRPTAERSREIIYYFEVPDDTVVTDFIWLDRPPIPLDVK